MSLNLLFLIINIVFLSILVYYFVVMKNKEREEKKTEFEEEKFHDERFAREEKRLKEELLEAHQRSSAILSQSEKIAQELIFELETVLGKKTNPQNLIGNENSLFEIELGSLTQKLKSNYITRIKELLDSLERFRVDKAIKVEAYAEEQMVTTDKNLQQMRKDELEKIRQRIEKYKEEELKLIDKKVREVIDKAAQEVLGQSLSSHEQDALIAKALEKAKKEGIL